MQPIIGPLIEIQQQLQIFHWQTSSFAQHKAFGDTYDAFGELLDAYIESLFGRIDRIFAKNDFSITLKNYSPENIKSFVDYSIDFLQNKLPVELNGSQSTDLQNIRDEMLHAFTKLRYLLTLS